MPTAGSGLVAGCDRGGWPERHLGGSGDPAQWGDLAYGAAEGAGVTPDPGETRTVRVSGTVPAESVEHGVVYVSTSTATRRCSSRPGCRGKVANSEGWFYEDRNNNSAADEGEAIAGLEVVLTDPVDGSEVVTATTQADGASSSGRSPSAGTSRSCTGRGRCAKAAS